MAKKNPTEYLKVIKDMVMLIIHFRHTYNHVLLLPTVCLFVKDLAFGKSQLCVNKMKRLC